jgi:hypothetical protein
VTFVDFKKAIDFINRQKMLNILKAYGIMDIIILAIKSLYQNSKAKVISQEGETEFFNIYTDVLRCSCTLSLYYCSLCHAKSHHLILSQRKSSRHPATYITDADLANDIALLSDTMSDAQPLLHRVETAAAEIELQTNEDKTEYINYIQNGNTQSLIGHNIKMKDDF